MVFNQKTLADSNMGRFVTRVAELLHRLESFLCHRYQMMMMRRSSGFVSELRASELTAKQVEVKLLAPADPKSLNSLTLVVSTVHQSHQRVLLY